MKTYSPNSQIHTEDLDGAALLILAMFSVAAILLSIAYMHNMELTPGYHVMGLYGAPEYMF